MTLLSKFDIHALRIGYYSDKYFLRTRDILLQDDYNHGIHYQYFPRKDIVLCGEKIVYEIFKNCTGYYSNFKKASMLFEELKINLKEKNYPMHIYLIERDLNDLWVNTFDKISYSSLPDGSKVKNMEVCIGIKGNPKYFGHLETATLGILAQQSAVATSVNEVVKRLNKNQKLLFFPARFKDFESQKSDGYAAVVGGANYMSTDANYEYVVGKGIGTIPHLLIACYKGDTAKAAIKFDEYIDPNISRIVLVDWDNDCIKTTLQVICAFINKFIYKMDYIDFSNYDIEELQNQIKKVGDTYNISEVIGSGKGKIFGVRFDTSGNLIDQSVAKNHLNNGVCPELIFTAKTIFNELGLNDLKIIVSGGFDIEKIKVFQFLNVPVDMYGIGSSIVNNFHCDFTADAVLLDGNHNAKVGRKFGDWTKLQLNK